jgi:pimeloyl-ACP methyl ester carboxylesterase
MRSAAQRAGDRNALEQLRHIGPPPHGADAMFTERTVVARLDGAMRPRELWKVGHAVLATPESSILDLPATWRGFRASLRAMWPEVSRLNLIELVPELKMPVFFFVGRKDHWVPAENSIAYFNALTAPSKQLVWFDSSAHEAFVDEPEKFNAVMVEQVLPAVTNRPARAA